MSRQILFNGSVLVRPGAATKIDASQFRAVTLGGIGTVAIIGEADDGPSRTVSVHSDAASVKTLYRSGDIVEAAAILADPGNDDRIPTGAQSIVVYKVNNALQASLTKSPHIFKTRGYGLQANSTTMALAAGTTTNERVVTITALDALGNTFTETSPSLGAYGKFSIQYIGAGSAATITITATALSTSVTGGPGSENLSITFADYRSLQEVIAAIAAQSAAYTCTAIATNVGAFDPTYLDALSGVGIKALTGSAASIAAGAATGQIRITGLTGMAAAMVGQYITISGAATTANNGTFRVAAVNSSSSIDVYNSSAVAGDANNGSVVWTTIPYIVFAHNYDLLEWVNANSNFVTSPTASYSKGVAGPIAAFSAVGLAGGTRGTSSNTNWTDAFTAIAGLRCAQVVPLASADATAAQGTFTIDSVVAALTAHCRLMSSTTGRSERQGWAGVSKTKTALITAAQTQNSEHVCLVGQKIKRLKIATGALEFLPEWATACALAGMRAGAPLGEPLTWKYVNALGLSSDSSWSEATNSDVVDLDLNGVIVINNIVGRGYRVDKCITTYLKADNDAFTEETVVQIWKNVAYELRNALQDRYTGRPGSLKVVQTVPMLVNAVLSKFRDEGAITDSVVNGQVVPAWRNVFAQLNGDQLSVSVTITPTPGINFVLNTIVLVPAQISA